MFKFTSWWTEDKANNYVKHSQLNNDQQCSVLFTWPTTILPDSCQKPYVSENQAKIIKFQHFILNDIVVKMVLAKASPTCSLDKVKCQLHAL